MEIAAAPRNWASICKGLKRRSTSPESTSIPSLNLAGTPAMLMRNSSNSVEPLPSGSSLGTGEKSFPHTEYCGTLLLSPPEWITRILLLWKSPWSPSSSERNRSTFNVAPPEPTRFPSGSGNTKYFVHPGSTPCSSLSAIWLRKDLACSSFDDVRIT